ncbi:LysR family transcriptional regulator [Sinirhodobacter ferrireducens]|uniref:LysR family transcriptional regulator n=1 Tax=Paenirhodobacter ferrireducens TaxID=1215032 RepID=A0A443LRX0_9RHOB|nr:LysR family transcriptional regulator [Sinirhodobacter ferrireducens]RWR51916.1 LysR family transcriptional regulator [Sinirhodobacter ferrireducens]
MDALSALQWDDIRFFLALARAGSLSRAARALRVEHSTVARRVTSLETALALRLFDRLASGWSLTAEGEELLAQAGAVEAQILGLARIAREQDPMAGRVRISAPPVLLAELLMPTVAALSAAHPRLTIDLEGSRREADMMRAEADIALRIGLPETGDLIARRIAEIGYGLYGAPGLPEGPAPRRWIGFDDSLPGLAQKRWLEAEMEGAEPAICSNDMATMAQAARAGLGLALLPHFLGARDAALCAYPARQPAFSRPLYLILHADMRRAPRVRAVADALVADLKARLDPR